ncbi:MAG: DUF2378 family protein [Myxococcota bacterium]|nr:DUF2378 family protein [Myxococcota bacterium]
MPPELQPLHRPPRFDRAIPLEEHVRLLPEGAACKGLFFNDPIERLRKVAPGHPLLVGGIAGRRYVPFFDYPYSDFMRLLAGTAQAVYPNVPLGEGLRRLGRAGYEALLQSHVGKVIFGVFGSSFGDVVKTGARGYAVSINFGKVEVEVVGPQHVRYRFERLPAFLETYQVGIVEGAMNVCKVQGEILVHLSDPANGSFDIRWRE